MKKILFYFIVVFFFNCKNNNKFRMEKKNNEKMNVYMLNYRTNYNFSISLNGFLIVRSSNVSGLQGGLIELNPFMNGKTEQVLTVEINSNASELIKYNNIEKQVFEIIEANKPLEDSKFEVIDKLIFAFTPNQNILHSQTEFISDVSYNCNEINLKSSKNLTKIDSAELLKKVISSYNHFGEIINNGDEKAYIELFDNAHQREITSMYYTKEETKTMINRLSNRIVESKGNLMPLKDYHMYLHPNGKIVELRTSDNKSPLYSEDDKKIRRFGVYLHMRKNSNKLEVY